MILEYAKAVKNGEQTCKILGGGGIQQNFVLGGSARDLTTCPWYILFFDRKSTPFIYLSLTKYPCYILV